MNTKDPDEDTDEEPDEQPSYLPMGPDGRSPDKWWPVTAAKTVIALLRGRKPDPLL